MNIYPDTTWSHLLAGQKHYFNTSENRNAFALGDALAELLLLLDPTLQRPRVIICIGTDRSTGDSLGPLVGTQLQPLASAYYHIYGTVHDPIHATNLEERYRAIQAAHPDGLIIAVDASLGGADQVGHATIGLGGLRPGAGVKKDLPSIGDLHITGIVNVGGFMEFMVLQNTRLSIVMQLAELISRGIMYGYYRAARRLPLIPHPLTALSTLEPLSP
ncbi:spore protease YyaC [Heliophilum fasciatum]|uniref:Putative sporulation protein YyaC n=1 Tax=Heliophilum fasciatum TaxID=35700 RepID=A0A4R2RLW0_9FIRM|nr:spore protease YyaC [Heliophilum fasciatum]MCW2278264.1 putative sporulation protein YyaC [Heliophilum fasciatum]TCP63888.1 putative sporulation protein YyaC [Heliophilum fasciatum]